MNKSLLSKHIESFLNRLKESPEKRKSDLRERQELTDYYQSYTKDRILSMTEEEVYEYISKLWAMLMWGNKHYVVDKILEENSLENFKQYLAYILWGNEDIEIRWDSFRKKLKGMGPAMISEILCKTHPNDYMLWNKIAYNGLYYLDVSNLPRYDYQLSGEVYKYLCDICKEIAQELGAAGFDDTSLLAVDYFLWDELTEKPVAPPDPKQPPTGTSPELEFIHDDIKDKLRDIGEWLGFSAKTEQKVSEGSKVDTIWEATIGNMGRIIYVFEVQTKGSTDSMILNLLKSLKNPSVQGVVAVSDKTQIEKIKKQAEDVKDLKDKLKCWDYEEVLKVHEYLAYVNETINNLELVPKSF